MRAVGTTDGTLAFGIDVGGTKIITAVVSARGRILARHRCPTPAKKGPDAVFDALCGAMRRTLKQAALPVEAITAIGLGLPGISDPETGIVFTSPNLPGWRDVPAAARVREEFGTPTFLINDANAAALGEMRYGAARKISDFVYITVSTGIGGAIVSGGKLYTGASGTAGELGHMTIRDGGPPCRCGGNGCWEALASGTALAREARLRVEAGEGAAILEHARGDSRRVSAETVHAAYRDGDKLAAELIAQTGYYLGLGFANIINIFNPAMIVVGGGLSALGEALLGPARETAAARAYRTAFDAVRIVAAALGDEAGVCGAADYARRRLKWVTAHIK